jgi:hypothetical protein
MHAYLLHIYDHALLHLIFNVDHHGDRSWSCACASLSKQGPIRRHAYVIYSAMLFFPF